MTKVAFLRHGVTDWNQQGRVQGQTDTALAESGRRWLRDRRLPSELGDWRVVVSPLQRARETAALLGLAPTELVPELVEMSWGRWEGSTWQALRTRHGKGFVQMEARGLDFRPPGGESPRLVQQRALGWLRRLVESESGAGVVAVTHKGVIRAVLARCWGWDMLGPPPFRLDWGCLQVVLIDAAGEPTQLRCNVPLESTA